MMSELLKERIISLTKELLSQVPFNTIYDYADIFFEKNKPSALENEHFHQQINFLKRTKLCDISYENLNEPQFFLIRSLKTQESIQFSNRIPTQGEFRGRRLRFFLNIEKINNPRQSLYDAIMHGIRSIKYSDRIIMIKKTVSGKSAHEFFEESISENHFDLYVLIVMHLLNQKILAGEINASTNWHNRWEKIDLILILEQTEILEKQGITAILKLNQSMIMQFSGPGNCHAGAKKISERLNASLIDSVVNYINTTDKRALFKQLYSAIDEANRGLKDHPHISNVFLKLNNELRKFKKILLGIDCTLEIRTSKRREVIERLDQKEKCILFNC